MLAHLLDVLVHATPRESLTNARDGTIDAEIGTSGVGVEGNKDKIIEILGDNAQHEIAAVALRFLEHKEVVLEGDETISYWPLIAIWDCL